MIAALRVLIAILMLTLAGAAQARHARHAAALDFCRIYGFVPHTRDYGLCRMNVRHYWTTGPCADPAFGAWHHDYCHINLPPYI